MDNETKVNIEDLTLGQAEFIESYTGLSPEALLKQVENERLDTKGLIALLAVSLNPNDPRSALEEARNTKISEVRFN